MADSFIYPNWTKEIWEADYDYLVDTVKATLIDLNDIGVAITAASNATPIVITAAGHGLSNGDMVLITQVGGNTAANGLWVVAGVSGNDFNLVGSVGNGSYTSGGFMVKANLDFWDDIASGAKVATATLASKTVTVSGDQVIIDAADVTWTSVTGDACECVIIWVDTGGADSTDPLVAFLMLSSAVTPNGGNITGQLHANGIARYDHAA